MKQGADVRDTPDALRHNVLELLDGGAAHASFEDAVAGLPAELRGRRPDGQSHTPWRLIEHMRLAQNDILRFILESEYESPAWPEGYWPQGDGPPDARAWDRCIAGFREDAARLRETVADPATDLLAPIPHGDGQTILREAMLVADHNAYHLGQLATVRRLLGAPIEA